MPNALSFLFSGNDLQKVIAASIQVEDVAPGGPAGSPPAGSMRLRFRQSDPGPVQIRPLLPGTMRFLVDPAAPGVIPDPATGSFTEADYAGWKTLGRIFVSVEEKEFATEIRGLAPALPVKPNRVWYGPVRLPPGFLLETLAVRLKKGVIRTGDGRTIRTTHADWRKHAIAGFLAGRYTPVLATSNDAAQDDRMRFIMPTVEVPADGNIELAITTALAQTPQDARDTAFEEPAPPVGREEPLHPRNGLIPAREVYRRLRADMVAEAAGVPLMDAILFDWPAGPRFFPIRFTRTAEPIDNRSAHFPQQTVSIRAGPALLHEERLPAHGVVFLRQTPPPVGQPAPAPPSVQISLAGTMKWLLGGGTSWLDKGKTDPVAIDLAAVAQPHIAVRLPMTQAIFSDEKQTHGQEMSCTFHSMRRTVRALIDNRIAGGRLNYGVGQTTADTLGIIHQACAGTPARASMVENEAPDPAGSPDLAITLIPFLEAFFPTLCPQEPIPNPPPTPTPPYTAGRASYHLWQTIPEALQSNETKRNFTQAHIGRGGPGAAEMLGLATYRVDPVRAAGEGDTAYFDRVVGLMLTGLQPGALLQFWMLDSDFEDAKTRSIPLRPDPPGPPRLQTASYGHSPLFVRYVRDTGGTVTGIRILDQHGERDQLVQGTAAAGDRQLPWQTSKPQIWIAANWTE